MAPKNKVEEPEKKPLIGRVGTNLRVGIVGVPNVGKSTFFNVLTKSAAPAENFPFCTIDPNENKYSFSSCFRTVSFEIFFNREFSSFICVKHVAYLYPTPDGIISLNITNRPGMMPKLFVLCNS